MTEYLVAVDEDDNLPAEVAAKVREGLVTEDGLTDALPEGIVTADAEGNLPAPVRDKVREGLATLTQEGRLPVAALPERVVRTNADGSLPGAVVESLTGTIGAVAGEAIGAGLTAGTLLTPKVNSHPARHSAVKRSKGGVIGTNGKPVISFRIDHGVDQWLADFWPLFRARGIAASVGVLSRVMGQPADPYEPTVTTWAELRAAATQGFEVWSHSHTHSDPAVVGTTLEQENVTSADIIESHGFRVDGYQMPGVPNVTVPDYSNNWQGDWSSPTGQQLLGRYGLIEAISNSDHLRFLPTDGCYGLNHYTLDGLTFAQAKQMTDDALAIGASVQWMLHPRFISAGSTTFKIADMVAFLDYVKGLWDAGAVEVLSGTGIAFADPNTSRRLNLLRDSDFASLAPIASGRAWETISSAGTGGTELRTVDGETVLHIPSTGAFTSVAQTMPSGHLDSLGVRGATFLFEGEVRCLTSNTAARVIMSDPTDTTRLLYTTSHPLTVAGGWTKVRVPFTLHPGTTRPRFALGRHTGTGEIQWRSAKVLAL
jgi:hypothetical protein